MNRTNAYYVSWLSGYRYDPPDANELRHLQRTWKCAVDVTHDSRSKTIPGLAPRYILWRSLTGLYQSEDAATSGIAKLSPEKTYSVFTVPLFDNGWRE